MTSTGTERSTSSLQFSCPACEGEFRLPIPSQAGVGERPACPDCQFVAPIQQGSAAPAIPDPDRPLQSCWHCGCDEFYVQKDFNRQLGLWIVVVSFLCVFVVMLTLGHLWGIGMLFVIAAVDWLVYRSIGDVSVCYLCHAIYRGFPLGDGASGFDLGDEEKYKHLRQAWLRDMGLGDASSSAVPETESEAETSAETSKASVSEASGRRDSGVGAEAP